MSRENLPCDESLILLMPKPERQNVALDAVLVQRLYTYQLS